GAFSLYVGRGEAHGGPAPDEQRAVASQGERHHLGSAGVDQVPDRLLLLRRVRKLASDQPLQLAETRLYQMDALIQGGLERLARAVQHQLCALASGQLRHRCVEILWGSARQASARDQI